MTNELKPCPFCGGEAEAEHYESDDFYGGYLIFCTKCGAQITPCNASGYDARKIAIESWNTRQPAFDWKPIEELPTFFNSRGEKNFDDDEKFLVTTGNKYGEFICKILANDNLLILSHGHKAELPRSKYTHYALLIPPQTNQS